VHASSWLSQVPTVVTATLHILCALLRIFRTYIGEIFRPERQLEDAKHAGQVPKLRFYHAIYTVVSYTKPNGNHETANDFGAVKLS
jgi:hypothetical protein